MKFNIQPPVEYYTTWCVTANILSQTVNLNINLAP